MATEFFDIVDKDKRLSAPYDIGRDFYNCDVQSLDAPNMIPAGSTKSDGQFDDPFHVTTWQWR